MKTKKNQLIAIIIVALLVVAGAAYWAISYSRTEQPAIVTDTDTIITEQTEIITDTIVPETEVETPIEPQIVHIDEAVIEGKMRMLYHDVYGEGEYITTYRTPGENARVSFIISCDEDIDVLPYLEEWDEAFGPDPLQHRFMVVPEFEYTPQDFAEQYANKRVKAVGSLYAPGGGWHNATEVVMSLKNITVLE